MVDQFFDGLHYLYVGYTKCQTSRYFLGKFEFQHLFNSILMKNVNAGINLLK